MEDSIRRAEKLVYAANSALAQMKYNLTFEDYEKESRASKAPDKGPKNVFLDDELQKYEEEFKLEANAMLSKMDKMLDPNQYSLSRKPSQTSKIRERMKEINYKLQDRSQEQGNFRETEQSRLKLLSLINQDEIKLAPRPYTKQISSSNNSDAYKNTSSTVITGGTLTARKNPILRKTDSLPTIIGNSSNKMKPSEELRNKLLETQEIVDRGFETARHLKRKVESLTNFEKKLDKTPSTVKTCFSENMNTTKSIDSLRKSESNETVKLTRLHRCKKHQHKEKKREIEEYSDDKKKNLREIIKANDEEKVVAEKNSLISIKREEAKKLKCFKLNYQRLPSLHIKGGLQIQRIHNLEILPENPEVETNNGNIGIKIITHEEVEREKINKIVETVERENCFCPKKVTTNRIQCFNCGRLNKVEENFVDPKEIDNLLMKCSFNVFDPRIDEFVEKYKQTKGINDFTKSDVKTSEENIKQVDTAGETCEKRFFEAEEKEKSPQKNFERERVLKIQEFGEELTQAYREKASQLEDDYEEFESILRGLFRKIDKSRRVFDNFDNPQLCSSSESKEKYFEEKLRVPNFTKTKPVIISFPIHEADQRKDVKETTETDTEKQNSPKLRRKHKKSVVRKKESKKRQSKKEDELDVLSKISENTYRNTILEKFILENEMIRSRKKEEEAEEELKNRVEPIVFPMPRVSPVPSIDSQISAISETDGKNILQVETNVLEGQFRFSEISSTESIKLDNTFSTENDGMKTENDYESDFERESIKNEDSKSLEEEFDKGQDVEDNLDSIKCMKKLSTILEVDSEAEKKISEVEFTNSSKEKSVKISVDVFLKQLPTSDGKSPRIATNNLNPKLDVFETRTDIEDFPSLTSSPKASSESIERHDISKNLENYKKADLQTQNVTQAVSDTKENPSPTKNNPTIMVTALKEVLTALQDQFHKTQSLAEKLTENVNTGRKEEKPSGMEQPKNDTEILPASSPVIRNLNLSSKELLTNLINNRKNLDSGSSDAKKSSLVYSTDEENQDFPFLRLKLQDEEAINKSSMYKNISKSPSLGNVHLDNLNSVSTAKIREQRHSDSSSSSDLSFVKLPLSSSRRETSSKPASPKSGTFDRAKILSPLPLESEDENISYSEGEVLNHDELENDRSSSQSIGEVISERFSEESLTE